MDAKQRRQARREFKRKYPYYVSYDGIKSIWEARKWCHEKFDEHAWTTFTYPSFKDTIKNSKPGFRFSHEQDAVYFTLMWVG